MIGINTAIIPPAQGICFAIPINAAKHILPQLMQHGRVVRGYLGLHGHNVPLAPPLARLLRSVADRRAWKSWRSSPTGPPSQAGIEADDLIVSLGEQHVTSVDDLHKLLTQLPVGVPSSVFIIRGARLQRFVLPEEYPHWDPARR